MRALEAYIMAQGKGKTLELGEALSAAPAARGSPYFESA
jgi:hypothetical protein